MINSFCDAIGTKCEGCTNDLCHLKPKVLLGLKRLIKRLDAIKSYKNLDAIKIIVRGLPGSGKSTLAHYLAGQYKICLFENDHTNMRGLKYDYNQELHQQSIDIANNCILRKLGSDMIFCDVFPDLEVETSDTLIVVTMVISPEDSKYSNIHNVLHNDIENMCQLWKPIDGEIYIDSQEFKEHFKLNK